jgi:hypothetical protein
LGSLEVGVRVNVAPLILFNWPTNWPLM